MPLETPRYRCQFNPTGLLETRGEPASIRCIALSADALTEKVQVVAESGFDQHVRFRSIKQKDSSSSRLLLFDDQQVIAVDYEL